MSNGWQEEAACRGTDLSLWFPLDGARHDSPGEIKREQEARSICMGCPVRRECLEFAQSGPEKHGTWGGISEHDRAYRKRYQRQRAMLARVRAAS